MRVDRSSCSGRGRRTAMTIVPAVICSVGLQTTAGAVDADAAAPAASSTLEEVIVTSRKFTEELQSAPVTATVISGQQLEDLDLGRPEDLARLTPGFHYEETGARFFNKPTIRGLSVNSIEYSNQKTQTFIDGIAFAGQFGSYPIDDGEYQQVEVLKGPQATAFGRGTLGGGINYITKDPTNDFSAIVSAEGRTNDETHDYVFLNVPLIDHVLSSYISLNYYNYGGPSGPQWHDIFNGEQVGNEASQDAAVKFIFTPNDWLTFKLRGSYGDDSDGLASFNFLAPSQANGTFIQPNGSIVKMPVGPISLSANPIASPDDQMFDPGLRRTTYRSEFTGSADLGPVTLTSVSAFNRQHDYINYGGEGTWYCYVTPKPLGCPYFGAEVPGEVDGNQQPTIEKYEDVQQEIRLTSNGTGPFKYMIGGDYFRWHWTEDYAGFESGSDQITRSFAAFGSVSYTIGDLTLGLEARDNNDKISVKNLNGTYGPTGTATFNRVLPRFTADYHITPDIMPYLIVSEGNHPGTFTTNPNSNVPAPVQEETLWNYEAGIKTEYLEHRLRVNVAAYHMIWKNQQLLENSFYFSEFTQSEQTTSILTNAGRSHINGVELEIDALPMTGLNLRGTFAYDRAVFDNFCSPQYYAITGIGDAALSCRSVAGNTLPQQPPVSASLLASYDMPLTADWNYFVLGDWSYIGRKYSDETNLVWTPPSNLVNLHAGVHNARWRAEIFVDNATQETTPVRASTRTDYQLLGSPTGSFNTDAVPQKPRQFGAKITYKFGH
jgi:iron complex outermembrane receptor protein